MNMEVYNEKRTQRQKTDCSLSRIKKIARGRDKKNMALLHFFCHISIFYDTSVGTHEKMSFSLVIRHIHPSNNNSIK